MKTTSIATRKQTAEGDSFCWFYVVTTADTSKASSYRDVARLKI